MAEKGQMKAQYLQMAPIQEQSCNVTDGLPSNVGPPHIAKIASYCFHCLSLRTPQTDSKSMCHWQGICGSIRSPGEMAGGRKHRKTALQHQFHAVFSCPGRTSQACACWRARCTVGCRLVDVFQNSVLQDETQNARGM